MDTPVTITASSIQDWNQGFHASPTEQAVMDSSLGVQSPALSSVLLSNMDIIDFFELLLDCPKTDMVLGWIKKGRGREEDHLQNICVSI